jgi:hypothetical protein
MPSRWPKLTGPLPGSGQEWGPAGPQRVKGRRPHKCWFAGSQPICVLPAPSAGCLAGTAGKRKATKEKAPRSRGIGSGRSKGKPLEGLALAASSGGLGNYSTRFAVACRSTLRTLWVRSSHEAVSKKPQRPLRIRRDRGCGWTSGIAYATRGIAYATRLRSTGPALATAFQGSCSHCAQATTSAGNLLSCWRHPQSLASPPSQFTQASSRARCGLRPFRRFRPSYDLRHAAAVLQCWASTDAARAAEIRGAYRDLARPHTRTPAAARKPCRA